MIKDEKIQTKSLAKASTEEKFDMIVEINDSILDRVGNILDEAEGLKKKHEDLVIATLNVSTARKTKFEKNTKWTERASRANLDHKSPNKVIRKPQLQFEDKIDNFKIFEPIIKFKHNSIKPLSIVKEYDQQGYAYYSNPYEVEINSYKLLDKYLKKVDKPCKPKSLEQTYFKFIDRVRDLNELLEYLRAADIFAVDLEYHAQRSFLGFTCLMQISTRDKDFIIDTIELRSYMHILNEIFTNPKILKVFHGAEQDIRWLQKEFGIYVVNMFDTGKAAKLLQFASFSLSFLVKHYCNEILKKKYQLADWRIRPLTDGMLDYARSDTHSLLYIFDQMRNDLIKKEGVELLKQAFEHSRKICLGRFEVPVIYENSYMGLIMKNRVNFNNRQGQALKDIYLWRDNLARTEDECTHYVMPNHMMLKIAEVLPQEQQGILACCNPIPVMVKKHLNELHLIVLKARELPLKKSNDYVYHLKPIVNQVVDITSNMDILDEEHADEHNVVTHDCLLDATETLHKIMISRTKTDENVLGNFFAIRSTDSDELKSTQEKSNLTPYRKYCKIIENKMKAEKEESKESESTKIDINQVPQIVSKDITNEPSTMDTQEEQFVDREEELTRRLETCPLIEINKKQRIKPDISCEVNKAIDNLISNAMTNCNETDQVQADESGSSDQFNYNQADYSIFSQNNQQQTKEFFDPSDKFMKQRQVNDETLFIIINKTNRKLSSSSKHSETKRSIHVVNESEISICHQLAKVTKNPNDSFGFIFFVML